MYVMDHNSYSEITPEIFRLANMSKQAGIIDTELFTKYDVKRGLRDLNGKGVLAGLTNISDVRANKIVDGVQIPTHGRLFYRGYDVKDLVEGFAEDSNFGYEEATYLLLFNKLPDAKELEMFKSLLAGYRSLPTSFVRDIIMKAPTNDMMIALSRSVLTLYSYDSNPDDISITNVLRQCLQLIAQFPLLAVYGYNVYKHYYNSESLLIRKPNPDYSIAENLLYILREDGNFTPLEAELLDICLVLHAEHGGGNNSSFTTHVVSSSGTDTYSSIAASLGSLKGPRHGGANIKVVKMIEDMKANLVDYSDESVTKYLEDLLDKKAFDRSGLIYGMGHAVYSLSDPRADILKSYIKALANEKNAQGEFELYEKIQRLAPEIIGKKRSIYKGVSCNIDFYSGFLYNMLGLPVELFTPIFAIARVVGWSAHRIEELSNNGKIIRPGYNAVCEYKEYVARDERK